MTYIIVGLGNPGKEYENTRHNTGRIVLDTFLAIAKFSPLEASEKLKALTSEGKIKKEKVIIVEPETFMNKSGLSVLPLVKSTKQAGNLIVIYDDIDLPLGKFKISFNRGSGGHKGIESIVRSIKTKEFIRVRVGVSPSTPKGKTKKPKGEDKVVDFILGEFKPDELKEIKKISKKIALAVEMIVLDGRAKAMGEFN